MSKLVLFARARETAGRSNDDIDAATLGELLDRARVGRTSGGLSPASSP